MSSCASGLATAYAHSLDCVHCGLCLAACPTYELTGNEAESPRGRIYLMRALAEGRIDAEDPGLRPPLDHCLDCRACESACPSGVRYSAMLEEVRSHRRGGAWLLDLFLASRRGHRSAIAILAIAERLGLLALARRLRLPGRLARALRLLPRLPSRSERAPIPPGIYEPEGSLRAEVGLFTGCVMETLFGRVNRAALRLLRANGCRVHVPEGQGCCGALHVHLGHRERARRLIDRNIAAFPTSLDAIVLDSAGCGSALKDSGGWHPTASTFAQRVRDLSEFLVELGPTAPSRSLSRRAAYDDACHLCHGQGLRGEPRALLARIPGLELVELARPEDCCGSAGIYNLSEPELADQVLARKLDDFEASGADLWISGNPGCLLQLGMGIRQRGLDVELRHTAEVLAGWCQPPEQEAGG